MSENLKAKVFISCGQSRGTDEERIARQIEELLDSKGFHPYVAIQQQSLKGLKENIFEELSSSEYFLFVDFKREQLAKIKKRRGSFFCHKAYRGSLFCHQELAIASFLDMPLVGFQEAGVIPGDGILQFLQANCTSFTDRHKLSNMIAEKIEKAGWKSNWKNQLVMKRIPEQFYDVDRVNHLSGERRKARFMYITVKNLNPHKNARNCYAYLETIHDLSTGNSLPVKSVESKWEGYVLPNATILRSSYRYIDGFYVFHDSPDTAHFNPFSDSPEFTIIQGSGDYELTYLVVSDNFNSIRSTFRLHLSDRLDAITFE